MFGCPAAATIVLEAAHQQQSRQQSLHRRIPLSCVGQRSKPGANTGTHQRLCPRRCQVKSRRPLSGQNAPRLTTLALVAKMRSASYEFPASRKAAWRSKSPTNIPTFPSSVVLSTCSRVLPTAACGLASPTWPGSKAPRPRRTGSCFGQNRAGVQRCRVSELLVARQSANSVG